MSDSVLVFGGSQLQVPIILQIKKSGYKAIVIDPDPNCLAREIADIFIPVKGDDFEETLRIAKDNNVSGIVTSSTDKPILMMCKIAEALELNFPSYSSCETLIDKSKFKKFLKNNGFGYARGSEFKGNSNINPKDIIFPSIVKPVMNSGSRGVIKCDNYEELLKAIPETLTYCNNARFLIEEYIDGDEISVEALVQNGILHIIQITDKIVTQPPYNVELAHIQPSKYEFLKHEFKKILQGIIDLSGIDNCALHPEFKIKNNNIVLIDLGPRLGGDYITSHLVPLSTNVNIEDQVIRIALGKKITYKIVEKASMIFYFNFPNGSVVKNIISDSQIVKRFPEIKLFEFKLLKGESVPIIRNSLDRYGFIILGDITSDSLYKIRLEIESFFKNIFFN